MGLGVAVACFLLDCGPPGKPDRGWRRPCQTPRRGVIDGSAEQGEIERGVALKQGSVATADDESDTREDVSPSGHPRGEDVRLDVVCRDDRNIQSSPASWRN